MDGCKPQATALLLRDSEFARADAPDVKFVPKSVRRRAGINAGQLVVAINVNCGNSSLTDRALIPCPIWKSTVKYFMA